MQNQRNDIDHLAKVNQHYVEYLDQEIAKELETEIRHLQSLVDRKEEILQELRKQYPKEKYLFAENNFRVIEKLLAKPNRETALRNWITNILNENQADMNQALNTILQKSGRRLIEQGPEGPEYAKLPQLIKEHKAATEMQQLILQHKKLGNERSARDLQEHYTKNRVTYSLGSTRSRSFNYMLGHLLDKIFGRNKDNTFSIWQKPSKHFQEQTDKMLQGINSPQKRPG